MDNFGSKILRKFIENRSLNDNSTDYEKADLLNFMINLFWRTPTSDLSLKNLIKKEGLCNDYFGLYDEKTKKRYSDDDEKVREIKYKTLTDNEFAKHLKIIIANSDATKKEIITLLELWNLFSLNLTSTNEFLISDLPFLHLNDSPTLTNVFKKIIFPISKNKVLILNKHKPKFIDDFTINGINLCVMQESERFIGSGNKELLEYYIAYYKEILKKDDTEYSVSDLFEYIDKLN
ncbi:MAG: hypothetical protein COA80_17865 [Leeuwenhoekiella sp.]|nr:MAG: hypothetical protein COA80_17865 [Leeuwenhoekiella sp.]